MVQEIDFSSVDDVTIDGNPMDKVNFNNGQIWNRFEPTIFSVKRYTPKDTNSNGPNGSHIKFKVTAGTYDAYVEYGGNTTTIPAGTTVAVSYGTDGTTDDGTPESGNITFSGDVDEIAGYTWTNGSKGITRGYGCITGVVQWGSLSKVGEYLFACTTLSVVDFSVSKRLSKIGNYAFFESNIDCFRFTEYPIEFGYNVFEDAKISSVDFPKWLTTIPIGMFERCLQLKSIKIPKTISSFAANISGAMTFQGSGLESVEFELPTSLKSISAYAFAETASLKHITIPEGITFLGVDSFWDSALESVSLPKSLLTIDALAFKSTNLTSVVIPANVNKIDQTSFSSCESLTSIVFENPNGWVDKDGASVDFSNPSTNISLLGQGSTGIYYTRS